MTNFQKIGVVGAGMMGSELAPMFALAGFPTQLVDVSRDAAGYDGRKAGRGWHRYDGNGKKR